MAVDYTFYAETYLGSSIPESEWAEVEARAEDILNRMKRIYTVEEPTAGAESKAICAIADAVYYFDNAANGLVFRSSSIGSVSSTSDGSAVDTSPAGQHREFYRAARLYLDIYRGTGKW